MFVLVKGIRSLVNGDMGKGEAIGMVAFGAVFATIPLGVIALMVIGAKRKKKAQSIRSAHRENPWLSKKEWVEGRIRSGPRARRASPGFDGCGRRGNCGCGSRGTHESVRRNRSIGTHARPSPACDRP